MIDPNWRDEFVEVEINGIRHNVHPDELAAAEQIRQYLRDAARTLREWTP